MGKKKIKKQTEEELIKEGAKIQEGEKPSELASVVKSGRRIVKGKFFVQVSYNNTSISAADDKGNVLAWSSAGSLGFKGPKKATPYAASKVAETVLEKVKKIDFAEVEIFVKGIGSGRESAVRSLVGHGLNIALIKDITPVPHNGPRPKKSEEYKIFMRYTGPKEKLSRKIGENLGLKAERSFSPKSAFLKKPYKPGAHGKARRRALSEFGTQLLEKQKIKIIYALTEKKLRKYYKEANSKRGITGDLLLSAIEVRLDNAVFRGGFAPSRTMARQLVSHGHFLVNNKKVTIPSYPTRTGDIITIRPQSRNKTMFFDLANKLKKHDTPSWLTVDKGGFEIKIKSAPKKEDLPKNLNINAVVSYYSR